MQIAGDVLLWFIFGVMAALVSINAVIVVLSYLGYVKAAREIQNVLLRRAWFLRLGNHS